MSANLTPSDFKHESIDEEIQRKGKYDQTLPDWLNVKKQVSTSLPFSRLGDRRLKHTILVGTVIIFGRAVNLLRELPLQPPQHRHPHDLYPHHPLVIPPPPSPHPPLLLPSRRHRPLPHLAEQRGLVV